MSTALALVAVVLGMLLVVYLAWAIPRWQVRRFSLSSDKERFDVENEARKTILQLLAGVVAFAGLYAGYATLRTAQIQAQAAAAQATTAAEAAKRQATSSQEQIEIASVQAKQQFDESTAQIKLASDGQVADRFSRAVVQLGDKEVTQRVSGIYALQLVASDSARYKPLVSEVLAQFLRTHQFSNSSTLHGATELSAVAPDLQAALGVLGRYFSSEKKDLSRVIVPVASISGSDFGGTSFYEADLFKASGERTRFVAAFLWKANLQMSSLNSADFSKAHLQYADLSNSDLRNASLLQADLKGANLSNANLQSARLDSANLANTVLARTKFGGANARKATFWEANLTLAELDKGNFAYAVFQLADFWLASTYGMVVRGADFRGAKHLTQAQLNGMVGDTHTRLPLELEDGSLPVRPATWR